MPTDMDRPDVIAEVLTDHAQINWLLDQVASETGDRRQEMFKQLAEYVVMHESAEQAVIHSEMKRLDSDEADDRLAEEQRGDQMLEELRAMGVDDPQFDSLFANFKSAVLRHAEREEREEHPKLRSAVDERRLTEMAGEFHEAEAQAVIGDGG